MNKKFYFATAASALLVLAGCSSNDTVATTSAGNVSKEELYQAMKKSSVGQQSLYRLLVEKVATANLKDKTTVENATNQFMVSRQESAGGQEAFINLVKNYGYDNLDDFKKAVYTNQTILQVIKENLQITDEDVTKAYETYEKPMTASHILVSDEAVAKDIIAQLNNGGDWNALAAQHSIDTANKDKGGSLGEFKPSSMVKEFSEALSTMNDGDISKTPVKSSFGFHIIKMEKKTEKGSFDAEKENVKNELLTTKANDSTTQQEIMTKLLKTANVKINDAQLDNALKSVLSPEATPAETTSSSSK